MLSRTAESLFWLARYVERAENMARLLDVGRRMCGIPGAGTSQRNEWPAVLAAAGAAGAYAETGRPLTPRAVLNFMAVDRDNPSSIVSCLEFARANARASRGALTQGMWEALNDAWLMMRALKLSDHDAGANRDPESGDIENGALAPLLDQVKNYAALFRGALEAGALRDDGYAFQRIGIALERLDNTVRLLDVKFFARGPEKNDVVDQYEWITVLRSAGVHRAFHLATHADVGSATVAGFLIQHEECPRSAAYCARLAMTELERLERCYGRAAACQLDAATLYERLAGADLKRVIDTDPHGFLSEIIRRNNALALAVAADFNFGDPNAAAAAAAMIAPLPVASARARPPAEAEETQATAAPAE